MTRFRKIGYFVAIALSSLSLASASYAAVDFFDGGSLLASPESFDETIHNPYDDIPSV